MRIFVDADACPKDIKEILFRAAKRTNTELILVSNHYSQIPVSSLIKIVLVNAGLDEADKKIAEEVKSNDLVVTADIPLADIVVGMGCIALNPRGKLYTKETIKLALATRDLMTTLRDNQIIFGGPAKLNKNDQQAFANQLDKILRKQK
ncbi:MAG: YaiI/YqxD family protein [Neisseriaceae bacterium]